jgi:hypothetical protein
VLALFVPTTGDLSFIMLNTSSSHNMMDWLLESLEKNVKKRIQLGKYGEAFLHLLALTMSAKQEEHWVMDNEDEKCVDAVMEAFAKCWTTILTQSDVVLQLKNVTFKNHAAGNEKPAREKLIHLLADWGRDVKKMGHDMVGSALYKFTWPWK